MPLLDVSRHVLVAGSSTFQVNFTQKQRVKYMIAKSRCVMFGFYPAVYTLIVCKCSFNL